jgi:rhodanese-related sulfurtransferase
MVNLLEVWQEFTSSSLGIAVPALIVLIAAIVLTAPALFKVVRGKASTALGVLVAIFIGYLFYYFDQPVRIVTATQFRLEKSQTLKRLQQRGLIAWKNTGLYLLDVRSRDEYAKGHLKASESLPVERAVKEAYPPIKGLDIVIFSANARPEEAQIVANAIKKRGEKMENIDREKFGTIYIISDGFEGLENAGLITEKGVWD